MQAQIQHVSIPAPAESKAVLRSFYGDLLGLEEMPVPEPVADLDLLWYRLGDAELHLFREEMAADRSARHFCIGVEDVEELRTRLEDGGVAVVGAPPLSDQPRYFCRDPFGNLIEFTTIG